MPYIKGESTMLRISECPLKGKKFAGKILNTNDLFIKATDMFLYDKSGICAEVFHSLQLKNSNYLWGAYERKQGRQMCLIWCRSALQKDSECLSRFSWPCFDRFRSQRSSNTTEWFAVFCCGTGSVFDEVLYRTKDCDYAGRWKEKERNNQVFDRLWCFWEQYHIGRNLDRKFTCKGCLMH